MSNEDKPEKLSSFDNKGWLDIAIAAVNDKLEKKASVKEILRAIEYDIVAERVAHQIMWLRGGNERKKLEEIERYM